MGIRTRLLGLLSAPVSLLLEGKLRDLIADVVDGRGLARAEDLRPLELELESLARQSRALRADLDASRQALDALRRALENDDDELEEAVTRMDAEARVEGEVERRLDVLRGTLGGLEEQLATLRSPVGEATARARQAGQLATTARATAEAAADGVSALETAFARLEEHLGAPR